MNSNHDLYQCVDIKNYKSYFIENDKDIDNVFFGDTFDDFSIKIMKNNEWTFFSCMLHEDSFFEYEQKRNGHVLCRIEKLKSLRNSTSTKNANFKLYRLKGSIKYQSRLETDYCEDKAIEVSTGECIYLPKGEYYYWVGKEGVEFITVIDDLPQKYFDMFNAINIDVE